MSKNKKRYSPLFQHVQAYFMDVSQMFSHLTQAQEEVSKNLLLIKNMLYGTSDSEPQTDIVLAQLSQELYNSGLLVLLIHNLARVDFEVCKTNILLQSANIYPFLFVFVYVTGEEGCSTSFQQHFEEATWHQVPHGGIHLHQA